MRVERLRKQVADQEATLQHNEELIRKHQEEMTQALQMLSKAFTTVMVDQQILETDKQNLDKELYVPLPFSSPH